MAALTVANAVKAINEHGALLLYPIDNRKEPESIWSVFFPKTEMRWEWDSDGDDRVAKLWHYKTELSVSKKVVYSKWYRGRATFFSKEVFSVLLSIAGTRKTSTYSLSREAKQILEVLEMDSPLSTKQIKALTELRGKVFESTYEKAMKELWSKFLIVGFGEVEDGAFPSLAVAATKVLFEDLWEDQKEQGWGWLEKKLGSDSLYLKQLKKQFKP